MDVNQECAMVNVVTSRNAFFPSPAACVFNYIEMCCEVFYSCYYYVHIPSTCAITTCRNRDKLNGDRIVTSRISLCKIKPFAVRGYICVGGQTHLNHRTVKYVLIILTIMIICVI